MPSAGRWSRRTWRATVTLWTSVGPSARPMTPAPWIIPKNGISLVVPRAPCTCIARQAMSCSTVGMTTLAVAMSFRTRL